MRLGGRKKKPPLLHLLSHSNVAAMARIHCSLCEAETVHCYNVCVHCGELHTYGGAVKKKRWNGADIGS